MNHPHLFKKSSTGALQVWKIWTEANVIVTEWGLLDGAQQVARDEVAEGKNLGKKNETTPTQQAESEAAARWEKKLKKGYVQSREDAEAGKVDAIIEGGISPMLAHRFDQQGHKLVYPCYVQPKLDGHRCIAMVEDDGSVTLWSRTRKPITPMTHIIDAIKVLKLRPGTVLDGELYNHDYKDRFEELTSYIRASAYREGADAVQYHVYDVLHEDMEDSPFEDRNKALHGVLVEGKYGIPTLKNPTLIYVETGTVDDEDELMFAFDRHLKAGYEGAMARNAKGVYVNKRSYDLLKIKEFVDSEFEVIRVEQGRGKLAGHAIFVCKTEAGAEFNAKLVGDTAALKAYWDDPSLAVGKMLTVKYQGLTAKNGVPRFPVALRFRDEP